MSFKWLWDRNISEISIKKVFKDPKHIYFLFYSSLLLARNNRPKEVFKEFIDPIIFCKHWAAIKKTMRQNDWNEPRIVFWQAVYEKLLIRYSKKGVRFRNSAVPRSDELIAAIASKLKETRSSLGLSQKELARSIKVKQQVVSRMESGRENFSVITLKTLATALGKKLDIRFE